MTCPHQNLCGGCPLRHLGEAEYRQHKLAYFAKICAAVHQEDFMVTEPIFIADGTRRRAELTFCRQKGNLLLGFNEKKSHEIIDLENCPLLTAKINKIIAPLRTFLDEFSRIQTTEKIKNKKFKTLSITSGDIWLTEAADGLDILLELPEKIALEHRMMICDFANCNPSVARISTRFNQLPPETVIEKSRPYIEISGRRVFIAPGTFLQASTAGEQALIDCVLRYIGPTTGHIADLFCGIGTFSYPLANNLNNKITAVDSSAELLAGFQKSINSNMIPNIKILQKNLFKYPLDALELKDFDIVIFDPPRAGAAAQTAQLAALAPDNRPQKIIAVSCNPHTFVNDANLLITAGYILKDLTFVDQFIYSPHSELVALFENS